MSDPAFRFRGPGAGDLLRQAIDGCEAVAGMIGGGPGDLASAGRMIGGLESAIRDLAAATVIAGELAPLPPVRRRRSRRPGDGQMPLWQVPSPR